MKIRRSVFEFVTPPYLWNCGILSNEMRLVTIKNGNGDAIGFDIVIFMTQGMIYIWYFISDAELGAASTRAETKMNTNKAHVLLCHGNEYTTRQTTVQFRWTLEEH